MIVPMIGIGQEKLNQLENKTKDFLYEYKGYNYDYFEIDCSDTSHLNFDNKYQLYQSIINSGGMGESEEYMNFTLNEFNKLQEVLKTSNIKYFTDCYCSMRDENETVWWPDFFYVLIDDNNSIVETIYYLP